MPMNRIADKLARRQKRLAKRQAARPAATCGGPAPPRPSSLTRHASLNLRSVPRVPLYGTNSCVHQFPRQCQVVADAGGESLLCPLDEHTVLFLATRPFCEGPPACRLDHVAQGRAILRHVRRLLMSRRPPRLYATAGWTETTGI